MRQISYYASRLIILIVSLIAVVVIGGCDKDRIVVPVCTCVVRGAEWTKGINPNPSAPLPQGEDGYFIHQSNANLTFHVNELITKTNEDVWIPGADIAMLEIIDANGFIPVIDDIDFGFGKYGDIYYDTGPTSEAAIAANRCREAWGSSMVRDGLVLLIARNIIGSNGRSTPASGFSESYKGGNELCIFPRTLTKENTKGRYIVLMDPINFGTNGSAGHGSPQIILAHEFGHVLMLGHGDGLDNDANGQLPPNSGPRLFDSYCDPNEFEQYDKVGNTSSLMGITNAGDKTITVLQKELARSAALLMPGTNYK